MLKYALRQNDPVMFIENLALYNTRGDVPEGDYVTPFGKANVLREGKDITIFSHGRAAVHALTVSEQLSQVGIDAEVVDLRSLRPVDYPTLLKSLRKTHRAVYAEEAWRSYGIGAEIAATLTEEAFDDLDAPIGRVAGVEVPMPYSKPLERLAMISPADIVDGVKKTLNVA